MSLLHLLPSLMLTAPLPPSATPLPASPPPGMTLPAMTLPAMTLEEAEAFARVHNPTLLSAQSRLAESKALAQVPRDGWLPKIGASAQLFISSVNNTTTVVGTSPTVDIPRIGGRAATDDSWGTADSWRPYPSTFVGVGIKQEIFDFGLLAARTAAADADLAAERLRLSGSSLDVAFAVTVAFLSVQAAHGVLDAATSAVKRAQAERDQAAAGVNAGLLASLSLDRADADLARFQVGLVRAQGGLTVARTLFATTIGYSGEQLETGGEAPTAPALLELSAALQLAFSQDPQLLALGQELRAGHERTEAVWAQLRPNLLATATLSTRAGGAPVSTATDVTPTGSGWIPVIPNWDVGVTLSFPLFDPVISDQARASTAHEEVLRGEMLEARANIVASVSQAHELAREAIRSLPALQRALEAAKRNYDQASARFGAGLGNSVELADAAALLTDADVQLALGRFETGRTAALFERSVGGLR